MLIKRDLLEKVAPFIESKEFISIIGPRQCGKSTFLLLLRNHISETFRIEKEQIPIVTFENRKLLSQFETDPVAFICSYMHAGKGRPSFILIDEFQYAEEGGQKLKLIYDTLDSVKIIITGSSSLDIKAKVGKYMVGRIFDFSLAPFNFHEYLSCRNIRLAKVYLDRNSALLGFIKEGEIPRFKSGSDPFDNELAHEYGHYSVWGGYPAVVLAKSDLEKRKIITSIYDNYVLKDIKTLLELATERNLYLLSQYLATQIGNIVVYQNLSQVSGLNYRKLKKHINILEETFVCSFVKPFFANRQKELSKNPKVFFVDMGFRNNLLESTGSLDKRPDAGAVIENTVFIRLKELFDGINKINFWRTKSGAEVDFILHFGERILPVEVKFSNFDKVKISKSLASFISSFKPAAALVLTRNYWGLFRVGNTMVVFAPIYYL